MNIHEARKYDKEVQERKQAEAIEAEREQKKRHAEESKYTREVILPEEIKKIKQWIKEAIEDQKKSVGYTTSNLYLCELIVSKLEKDGYTVGVKQARFIPEERSYGDSGEGMHDSYWEHPLEISGW